MLSELHIENIAVIEKADISFCRGMNVLCGETGSGKSIIIDSINAVLGSRLSKELVRKGAENALVTAVFDAIPDEEWLKENDIETDGELILQRKINREGKSSCRVCGIPVSAAQLRELASQLVDVHGQNDGLRLLDEKSHLGYLDRFAGLGEALAQYKAEYAVFRKKKEELEGLSLDDEEKSRLSDSLRYRIEELEDAKLQRGEYDELSARRDILRNSEKLREALENAVSCLDGGDDNAVGYTQNARYYAERAARIDPELEGAVSTLDDAYYKLADALEVLRDYTDSLDFSPDEYDKLERRIALIDRLGRKYSRDEDALIDFLEECRQKLDELEFSADRIKKLEKEIAAQASVCRRAAAELTESRKHAAEQLRTRIVEELRDLSMPAVRFTVEFTPVGGEVGFDASGADEVRFLMSANAGEEPGRISRIASGGELSRIMLALKSVFAEHDTVQTMIFDEIDTGVSGIAAQRVAEKLYRVSGDRQVMCVTHLPQLAAMADHQYVVAKKENNGRTYTEVTLLDEEGRKKEIARLFGGDHITQLTLDAAAEQLAAAERMKN